MTALPDRRVFEKWLLLLAAVFAIVWAVIRASIQSITMDEADTYFWFVANSKIWYSFPNNHVLNSLLIWITTHAFGTSSITIRAPALFGAILYIGTCYFLCRNITDRFSIQLPVFICLTYNPFIFDYMVAARGYGLANAFLLAAIAVPVWHRVNSRPALRQSCTLASLALGLSFTANFSFAFVDAAACLVVMAWAIRRRGGESAARIVGSCLLPGLFVALLLCGYPLTHWRRDYFEWGAHSLREMRQSLMQSSLYQLDPRFRASGWYRVMDFIRPRLPPLLVILCLCQLVVTICDGSWLRDARARRLGRFAAGLAAIVTLSVVVHWLAFHFYKLPLPLGRTGIFLVPLITLLAGTIASAPALSVVSQWLRRAITVVLFGFACYFLFCLRLSYFKEYQWDADTKEVYSVLARLNHTYGVTDVGMNGLCVSSLNYYRVMSKGETYPEFQMERPDPPVGKSVYVMSGLNDRGFIDKENLVVIYRGKFSDLVIAVRPDGPIPATMIER